mgnify:FL=1
MNEFLLLGILFFAVVVMSVVILIISRSQDELKNKVEYLQDQIDNLRNQLLG